MPSQYVLFEFESAERELHTGKISNNKPFSCSQSYVEGLPISPKNARFDAIA